jgi:hypothetical protein
LDAWGQAKGTYDKAVAKGPYSGDTIAQPNQDQYDANNAAIDFYKGLGGTSVSDLLKGGSTSLTTGQGATDSALKGLTAYTNSDTLDNTISGAQKVAAGFDVPGAVKAAMYDANTEASDETLPSLYRGAAGSGNINSDRTALAEGVVKKGLATKAADLSAELQNSAYNTGLSTAQRDTTSLLGALSDLGTLGGQSTTTGNDALSSGITSAASNFGIGAAGAEDNQSLAQDVIDNDKAKYDSSTDYTWDQLAKYYGITGSGNWGSEESSTKKTTNTPSTLSTIGSGLGAAGGLLKK